MIDSIRRQIEEVIGRKLHTQRDFTMLSELIEQRKLGRVSASTLRRTWGISNEGVHPSRYTLDVLSRFLMYRSYDDYIANNGNESQSGFVMENRILSDELRVGEMLCMEWRPNRKCLVRHMGGGRFVIESAENTKLCKGDTFRCHLFINNEPLLVDDLMHQGEGPLRYVAGKNSGVNVARLPFEQAVAADSK